MPPLCLPFTRPGMNPWGDVYSRNIIRDEEKLTDGDLGHDVDDGDRKRTSPIKQVYYLLISFLSSRGNSSFAHAFLIKPSFSRRFGI